MNGNIQSQTPLQAPQPTPMLPEPKRPTWLWITLVVVAVVVAGVVLYFILLPEEAVSPTVPTAGDLSAIEEELQGVDLEGLDSELDEIDKELQGL